MISPTFICFYCFPFTMHQLRAILESRMLGMYLERVIFNISVKHLRIALILWRVGVAV